MTSSPEELVSREDVLESVRLVFGEAESVLSVELRPEEWSRETGGRHVDVHVTRGWLRLHAPSGQITAGFVRTECTRAEPVDAAIAITAAEAFVARVFPWAAALDRSARLGSAGYRLAWGAVANGVSLPSFVDVDTDLCGTVNSFAAWHEPHRPVPTVAVREDEAVRLAEDAGARLGGCRAVAATLVMRHVGGQLRTYWRVELDRVPSPEDWGYHGVVGIDAESAEALFLRSYK